MDKSIDIWYITKENIQNQAIFLWEINDFECSNSYYDKIDIYKNRRGELNCVKIFRYFDYATCHCTDYFVTDGEYHTVENVKEIRCVEKIVDYSALEYTEGEKVV